MLITQQKVFRKYWYPIVPLEILADGPQPFVLMGQSIVLWLDESGKPCATVDRCCHRSAKLSNGWVSDGCIVCPYHGWRFDGTGRCRSVPQIGDRVPNEALVIHAYGCEVRYGYVWVCLEPENAVGGIPEFEEAADPAFRQIFEFYERWECASLRLMENSFDAAHIAFVHKDSFGDINKPIPELGKIYKTPNGSFYMLNKNRVDNSKVDRSVTGEATDETYRTTRTDYYPPVIRKSKIQYPGGLIHSIVTCATPIADGAMQLCQWVYRNDTEADVPAEKAIAFDRKVTIEDRHILESCDPDVPIDQSRRAELHMASDRPGMLIRNIIQKILTENGETEVYGQTYESFETTEVTEYRKNEIEPVLPAEEDSS